MMFKAYYGLSTDPFPKDVDIKNYFPSKDFQEALNRLEFLKETNGFGLITGQPGVGKSFLLRYFVNSLNSNLYKCVYIPISTLTVMDFYRAIGSGTESGRDKTRLDGLRHDFKHLETLKCALLQFTQQHSLIFQKTSNNPQTNLPETISGKLHP